MSDSVAIVNVSAFSFPELPLPAYVTTSHAQWLKVGEAIAFTVLLTIPILRFFLLLISEMAAMASQDTSQVGFVCYQHAIALQV